MSLLIIVGAGASFDSIPSRRPRQSDFEPYRPPLADELFQSRVAFEGVQRALPQVLQIAPSLQFRPKDSSVEDVLGEYADEVEEYPHRAIQLAAVRYYIQGVITACEVGWYRNNPLGINLGALLDRAERFRRGGQHASFVTFNYDRMIESALGERGEFFRSMQDYVNPATTNLYKLHGSVDWAHRIIGGPNFFEFHAGGWEAARLICDEIGRLRINPNIEIWHPVPPTTPPDLAFPAIAIPVKAKSSFECPPEHVSELKLSLPDVRHVLTIGWRGAERHFLDLFRRHANNYIKWICVGSGEGAGEETIDNLKGAGLMGEFEAYNNGFSQFVEERGADALLRSNWS